MQLPNNIAFAVATAFAAAVSITAITNAAEAVASAANTFAVGDFVEYTGGWSKANGRVFRVKLATGTTFTLEGLDTTDTSLFPAGAGVGTMPVVPLLDNYDLPPAGSAVDVMVDHLKVLAGKEPERVAEVVKQWVQKKHGRTEQ